MEPVLTFVGFLSLHRNWLNGKLDPLSQMVEASVVPADLTHRMSSAIGFDHVCQASSRECLCLLLLLKQMSKVAHTSESLIVPKG